MVKYLYGKKLRTLKKFSINRYGFGVIKQRCDRLWRRSRRRKTKGWLALQHKRSAMIRAKQHQPPGWVVSLADLAEVERTKDPRRGRERESISLEEKKKIEVYFN